MPRLSRLLAASCLPEFGVARKLEAPSRDHPKRERPLLRRAFRTACVGLLAWGGALAQDAAAPQASDLIAKARAFGSYRCRFWSLARTRLKVEGEEPRWTDQAFVADLCCRTPDRRVARVKEVSPKHAAAKVRELQSDQLPDALCIIPGHVWASIDRGQEVLHIDLQKEEVRDDPTAQAVSVLCALNADPVSWLLRIEPETARIVETKTERREDGTQETLYVIAGTPRVPLGPKAFDTDADRSLRVTVGQDGFPRHVRAVEYTPRYDVLEFTVTEYEIAPDLPDDAFEFTPPEGVKTIEVDPHDWQ